MHPKLDVDSADTGCDNHNWRKIGYTRLLRLATMAAVAVSLLSACASAPAPYRAQIEDREVLRGHDVEPPENQQQSGDSATPYSERQYHIERAEYYGRLADDRDARSDESLSIDAALSAAEFYIQANDTASANRSVAKLDTRQFSGEQRNRYEIVLAYIEYSRGECRVALNRLRALLANAAVDNELDVTASARRQQVDALLLASFCYQELQEFDQAVAVLIEREAQLAGGARAETSRYIWQVINGLTPQQRQNIIQLTSDPLVRNRFEQSLQGQVGATERAPSQFDQWRNNDPAAAADRVASQWSAGAPKTIAVLLPLTSRFNKAAQAVRDGIEYQHSLNLSPYRPRLDFYDIGDNPLQTPQYYAAARQNGADLVIGPLGKDYADQLSRYGSAFQTAADSLPGNGIAVVPTILLGGELPLEGNFSRLTLSPERQAKIVADRAHALGYVNAAVLVPQDEVGSRTAEAFAGYWLASGGKLSNTVSYSPKQFDHSTELKQLFNINHSEYRYKKLSDTLGFKPKFAPYRRDDIDFIFMIADNDSGRIVRPQINFFSNERQSVLATSSVYNGIQDEINNVDLERTIFPVMPWVLRSIDVAPYAGQLNMLFAMGTDAYQLAPSLLRMQRNPALALEGNMGTLRVEDSGEISYQPLWAQFKNGVAETETQFIPLTDPFLTPGSTRPGNPPDRQNKAGSYNESNWDSRQSRRKAGS